MTQLSGTGILAAAGGGVSGFVDAQGVEHFTYIDTNYHIQEIVFSGTTVAPPIDVTADTAGAVTVQPGTGLSSFCTSYDQHWIFLGTNGHIYQIIYNPETSQLSPFDMTQMSGGGSPAAGGTGVTGFLDQY